MLATLGVPLAMVAALLTDPLLMPPLFIAAWWFAPRGFAHWLHVCSMGLIGMEWATAGAYALRAWPDQTLVVGGYWASTALLLSLAAWHMRRMHGLR